MYSINIFDIVSKKNYDLWLCILLGNNCQNGSEPQAAVNGDEKPPFSNDEEMEEGKFINYFSIMTLFVMMVFLCVCVKTILLDVLLIITSAGCEI